MNLDILQQGFATTDNPGMDTLDPRWAELSGLVQNGQFKEAAEQSHQLLQEGICDVRLMGYLCFGRFFDDGPACLAEVFGSLAAVLDGSWDALGPPTTRPKTTQQSLVWLLKQIMKQVQHVEQAKGDEWQAWTASSSSEGIDEALNQVFLLQQALEARLQAGAQAVSDPLGKLQAWLRAFAAAELVKAPPAAEPPPEQEPGREAEPPAAAAAAPPREQLGGSYHLNLLLRKIEVLSTLLGEQKMVSARIAADDIHELLARFDPLLYFPSLFAPFARLMARHAAAMAEIEIDPEAAPAKALRALYNVDLEEFMKLD